ncbi:hypothetical protein CFP56_032879 [Quercus suber]|uniref:RNase H type-1 domain-containing protein n=1 Tax=Quercus suber TaxID=58331 RepID=A0AAW0LTC2_QUESU
MVPLGIFQQALQQNLEISKTSLTYSTNFNCNLIKVVLKRRDLELKRKQLQQAKKEALVPRVRPTAVAAYENFTRNRPSVAIDISRSPARIRLIPPPRPLFKFNFDGTVFNEDRKGGVGIVFRSYLGQVMASMTEKCNLSTLVD